jgi:hypothetical protein
MPDDSIIGPWFETALTVGGGECRGDRVEHVQDLFRLLRRAREYLALRGGGSKEEEDASRAWYTDMDANDEWTGNTAEAHADAVLDIVFFFEEYAAVIAALDRGLFLVDQEWRRFDPAPELEQLRKDVSSIQSRIGRRSSQQ